MNTETRTNDQGHTYLMVEKIPGAWRQAHNPEQCETCDGQHVTILETWYDVRLCTGPCKFEKHYPIGD